MKLYHGTNVDFEQIDIAKSKPNYKQKAATIAS